MNEAIEKQIPVILNPTQKMRFGILSSEQTKIITRCTMVGFIVAALTENLKSPFNILVPLSLIIVMGYGFYKYASTHEQLQRSKAKLRFYIRRFRGYTTILKLKSPIKLMQLVIPEFEVGPNGRLDFGNDTWGYIILCNPRKPGDDEIEEQIDHITRFINSFNKKIVLKIITSSQIPATNTVENICVSAINNTKSPKEREIIHSMYDESHNAKKPVIQNFTIFLGLEEISKDQIDIFSEGLLDGTMEILKNAKITANRLTIKRDVMSVYVNEFSETRIDLSNRPMAFLKKGTILTSLIRQLLPSIIVEHIDHIHIGLNNYVSCVVSGMPSGGVTGWGDPSPSLVSHLFRLNISGITMIKTTVTIVPIDPTESLTELRQELDTIEENINNAEESQTIQMHYAKDKNQIEPLYEKIKRGEERLNHVSFIVTASAYNYNQLTSGLVKIQAVLSSHNCLSYIPAGEILETIRLTRPAPLINYNQSIQMGSKTAARITPLITNSTSKSSDASTAVYFGHEGDYEVCINPDEIAAGHCVVLGPTGGGKTTVVLSRIIMEIIFQKRKVIYITIKEELDKYNNVADYFGEEEAQIINIGPTLDPYAPVYNINPLEIIYDPDTSFIPENVFNKQISTLKKFISVLCGKSFDDSPNQQTYFESSLRELYNSFGFDPKDPSTWHPEEPPTLKHLLNIWKRDKGEDNGANSASTLAKTANALYAKLSSIESGWSFLSIKTNVEFNKKLTIVNLSGVKNIDKNLAHALNYLLTAIIALRFNLQAKEKTTIVIDEARVFLKNKDLITEIVDYLSQGRSFGIRLIFSTQHVSDLDGASDEFKQNTFMWQIMVNNIYNNIDILARFLHLSNADINFARNATRSGQCLLLVGAPYRQSYHLYHKLTPLLKQIIFGENKTDNKTDASPVFSFVSPDLEKFARDQGVICADWLTDDSDTIAIKKGRTLIVEQRAVGRGRASFYVSNDLIKNTLSADQLKDAPVDAKQLLKDKFTILNQGSQHYLNVIYIAGHLIKLGLKPKVNHYNGVDIECDFPSGLSSFEYQTAGNNDRDRLMRKRKMYENTHGSLFFVGDLEAVDEMKKALDNAEIIIPRGTTLEKLIDRLMIEKTEQKN